MTLIETGKPTSGNSFCQARNGAGTVDWIIRKTENDRGSIWKVGEASAYALGILAPANAPTVAVSDVAVEIPQPSECTNYSAMFVWSWFPLTGAGAWAEFSYLQMGEGCWAHGCNSPSPPDYDGAYNGQIVYIPCVARSGGEEVQEATGDGGCWEGTYYCAVRFVDADGVPSSLSTFATCETEYLDSITWSAIPAVDATDAARVTTVELYRSLVNNSRVVYKVYSAAVGSFSTYKDTKTDEELLACAALPIYNDDGTLCARRFERPPDIVKLIVPFKDRFFGISDDAVFPSYVNEPESMPTANRLDLCLPADDPDDFVAAIATDVLWLFRHRSTVAFSYAVNPVDDAAFKTIYARGALNMNCVARLHETVYAMDENGAWRLGATAESISDPVQDHFRDDLIAWANRDQFFVSTDPAAGLVKFHIFLTTDTTTYPSRALVYDANNQTWSTEKVTTGFGCGAVAVCSNRARPVYGSTAGAVVRGGTSFADFDGNIAYAFKSASFSLTPSTGPRISDRKLVITYKPTTADHLVTVNFYYDEDTTPVNSCIDIASEGVTATIGSPNFTINLKSTAFREGASRGYHRLSIPSRADARTWTHQSLTITLSGTQSAEEICFYGIEIEPAT
jgi:hypothetical protein